MKFQTAVIKVSGSIIADDNKLEKLAAEVNALSDEYYIALVVGGKPQINKAMQENGMKPEFEDGLRVTDKKVLDVVIKCYEDIAQKVCDQMAAGNYSKPIVLRGHCNRLIKAKRLHENIKSLVGNVASIDELHINNCMRAWNVAVIVPTGYIVKEGTACNINADEVASELAHALKAEKLIFVTEEKGVRDEDGKYIGMLNGHEIFSLEDKEAIKDGMRVKLDAAHTAAARNIPQVWITNDLIKCMEGGLGTRIRV